MPIKTKEGWKTKGQVRRQGACSFSLTCSHMTLSLLSVTKRVAVQT